MYTGAFRRMYMVPRGNWSEIERGRGGVNAIELKRAIGVRAPTLIKIMYHKWGESCISLFRRILIMLLEI